MKYIMESLRRSKAGLYLLMYLITLVVILTLNTLELQVITNAIEVGGMFWINSYIALVVISMLFSGLCEYFSLFRITVYNYLYMKLMDKVLRADYILFEKYSPGSVIKVISDISRIVNMIMIDIGLIRNLIDIIIILVFIGLININVIAPILIAMFIMGIVGFKISKLWIKYDEEDDNIKGREHDEEDEIVNGFAEVRSFPNTTEVHFKSLLKNRAEILALRKKKILLSVVMSANIGTWKGIISIGVLLYVTHGYMGDNTQILTLMIYIWRLMEPLATISMNISDVSEILPKMRKYAEIIEYENKVPDGDIELMNFNDSIIINDVSFSYDTSNTVLEHVNINIRKGQHIGICGASGCGKSTLLKLLNRFYDVDIGSILIDGIDIRNLTHKSLRKFIGSIHQDPYIFNGTIKENILYGISRNITEDELIEACKMAKIYDFIKSLEDGFDAKVGPRGIKLSGGQKQRISIARLFILNPEIIILDEATSALDNETEASIQDAMNIFKDKTIIAVAHRLSTIEDSDIIYVFENHTVSESGTHEELMKLGGAYANMHKC